MNKALRLNLLLRVATMWLAIAVLQGCGTNQGQSSQGGQALSWDSPKMRQIKAEWQSLCDTHQRESEKFPKSSAKERFGDLLTMSDRLLRRRLSDRELRELALSCDALPIRDADRDAFDRKVLGFMVRAFVATGDRDSLVKLLSTRGVKSVIGGWPTTVEFYLASRGRRPKLLGENALKDPILVLGDAYFACKVPEVREEIAFAVRRGFGGLGIDGKDDAEFIRNAMRWYQENKGRLVVNERYSRHNQEYPLDEFNGSAEEYERRISVLGPRELLFHKELPGTLLWVKKLDNLPLMLPLWLIHAAITSILTAPIVFFGRKRVHWRGWELLSLVLPFAVWAILMTSELADDRKTSSNILEQLYFVGPVPLAAIVRVAVGSRRREPVWAAALLVALCAIAAAVFFLVPPWPGAILL